MNAARQPTAAMPPLPRDCWQCRHRAEHHATVGAMLGANDGANERWPCRGVVARQSNDVGSRYSGLAFGTIRGPLGRSGHQFVESAHTIRHKIGVNQTFVDNDLDHRKNQRGVGSRARLDEPIGGVGRDGANRIDHHNARAIRAGTLDKRPQVTIRQLCVRSPQQNQLGVLHVKRIGTQRAARYRRISRGCDCAAQRTMSL